MKPFFKNKKFWALGGVFSLGVAAFAGFSYYKGWFGTDFAERTPQSKTRIVYQAAQDIVAKLRMGKIKSAEGENLQGAYLRGLIHTISSNRWKWLKFNGADLRRADLIIPIRFEFSGFLKKRIYYIFLFNRGPA